MQQIIDFIIANYRLIIETVILILSVIIFTLRKKPVHTIDEEMTSFCYYAILEVEDSHIIGSSQKLQAAIDIVKKRLLDRYPGLDVSKYEFAIKYLINSLLKLPQSHDGK